MAIWDVASIWPGTAAPVMHSWFTITSDEKQVVVEWLERGEDPVEYCRAVVDVQDNDIEKTYISFIRSIESKGELLYSALQCPQEFMGFLDLIKHMDVRSYLEVGARYGGSFDAVMSSLPEASGTAIDFPGAEWGDHDSTIRLLTIIRRLREAERDVSVIFGPSAAPEVVSRAQARGPYDCVFIDADHSYEGVKRDWELYGPMGKMIVFHDINNRPLGVPRLWNEIKDGYKHLEIVTEGSGMGIGVIFRG